MKKIKLKSLKFLIAYLIYVAVLAVISVLLMSFFPQIMASQYWLFFGFLAVLTFIAYTLANFGIQKSPEAGVFSILGAIIIKMLFAMSFALIYSLKRKDADMIFALNFFSLYLLFSLFEILGLLRNLRHQNK